ncbi:hypothetical protein [Candidatus Nanohalococcus occultus]
MERIEPVRISVEGDAKGLDIGSSEIQSNWPDTYNYVLDKLVGEGFEIIDQEKIADEWLEAVDEVFQELPEIASGIVEDVKPNAIPIRTSTVLISNSNMIIIPGNSPGFLYILSESEDEIEDVVSSFEEKLEEVKQFVKDFGLNIQGLERQDELAQKITESFDAELIEREEAKNDFEEEVYEEIKTNLTSCLDTNIHLRFGEEENRQESFEYDILVNLSPKDQILVAVKDASHEDADLSKEDVIRGPNDKSEILGVDCIVLVKDLEEEKLDEYKPLAERRDISLIEYDKNQEYLKELETLMKVGLRSTIKPKRRGLVP